MQRSWAEQGRTWATRTIHARTAQDLCGIEPQLIRLEFTIHLPELKVGDHWAIETEYQYLKDYILYH